MGGEIAPMDPTKTDGPNEWTMLKVLDSYGVRLQGLDPDVLAERIDPSATMPDIPEGCAHVMWMLEQIPNLDNFNKQMRWVCFIQGVLWQAGSLSVNEAIDHNSGMLAENANG